MQVSVTSNFRFLTQLLKILKFHNADLNFQLSPKTKIHGNSLFCLSLKFLEGDYSEKIDSSAAQNLNFK